MSKSQPPRPVVLYGLMAGLLFQGLSALGGGSALILDPSGCLLQMPRGLLVLLLLVLLLVPAVRRYCAAFPRHLQV